MQIHFSEIPHEGLRLEINDESWFPNQELKRRGPVSASVYLKKQNDRVLLNGTLDTQVQLDCDRCLESFVYNLNINFSIEFELIEGALEQKIEIDHVCSASEMDMVYLDKPIIDIFYILRQQVFLALPVKRLCSEDCKGLCGKCGTNLNVKQCDCKPGSSSSPFGVLEKLKH